ncbi:2'-deoxynucleoside 5'-phosphate N-hydrolase 1 isoform X2 [Mastomys coucha]|uniref:2'-deoxynucleoside 5'-phosphate N-hydrolase 1 isoform X2 n=1 Tax=Mastomys coucha TaxID=35658 RepID=UPI00126272FB|nr:2'-deoxynucleoside 5'-phosphate N-hydrolase 1 isoform X2 [Mastomys coucha]
MGRCSLSTWLMLSWSRVVRRRGLETRRLEGEEAAGGDRLIHEQDLAWLQQADVVVAEVTQPSLGVGYELGRAVALGKPILCLFRPQSGRVLSAMIRGAADGSRFQVWDYEEGEVETMLDRYFQAHLPQGKASSSNPSA